MTRILIVEDDPPTSAMVARLLSSKGYQTRVESNGAAALLAAHEDLPNLIVMDLQMPILTGQETIHALRDDERTAHIPVVVLSASSDDQTIAEAVSTGANVYLVKPPDIHALLAVVERLATLTPREADATT
jgi:CheY-like chemotaxis protein